jgi:hypothetical protein
LAARENGTARTGLSPPPTRTLVTPYCKRTRPGRRTTRRPRVSPLRLSPSSFPPLCSVSRRPIWAGAHGDNLLVGPVTPGVETPTITDYYYIQIKLTLGAGKVYSLRPSLTGVLAHFICPELCVVRGLHLDATIVISSFHTPVRFVPTPTDSWPPLIHRGGLEVVNRFVYSAVIAINTSP